MRMLKARRTSIVRYNIHKQFIQHTSCNILCTHNIYCAPTKQIKQQSGQTRVFMLLDLNYVVCSCPEPCTAIHLQFRENRQFLMLPCHRVNCINTSFKHLFF